MELSKWFNPCAFFAQKRKEAYTQHIDKYNEVVSYNLQSDAILTHKFKPYFKKDVKRQKIKWHSTVYYTPVI